MVPIIGEACLQLESLLFNAMSRPFFMLQIRRDLDMDVCLAHEKLLPDGFGPRQSVDLAYIDTHAPLPLL